jgi:hypothetical protein
MEVFMHGTFDRSGKSHSRTHQNFRLGIFLLPALLMVASIALAVTQPAASLWISQAAQAEFVGDSVPDGAPTQLAQPALPAPRVTAN